MKTINKPTIENFMKVADQRQNDTVELKIGEGKNQITVNVRRSITLDEFYLICGIVGKSPFAVTDEGVTTYVPSAELSHFKVAIIKTFIPEIELPEDVTEAYMLISDLGLYEKVFNILENNDIFKDLCILADRFSEYHRLSNTGLNAIENAFKNVDMDVEVGKIMPDIADKIKSVLTPIANNNISE